MLEYGIKTITTNPTLITKSKEIIKLVDSRNHKTRAFVLPASYEPIIEKIVKDMEFRNWVARKKTLLSKSEHNDNLSDFDEMMEIGFESIDKYLGDKI